MDGKLKFSRSEFTISLPRRGNEKSKISSFKRRANGRQTGITDRSTFERLGFAV